MATAFLADPFAKEHAVPVGHPERAARWDAAVRGLGGAEPITAVPRRVATELRSCGLCHTAGYLATARRDVEAGAATLSYRRYGRLPAIVGRGVRYATGTCLNGVDLASGRRGG